MEKIILLLIGATIMLSCGRTEEEQMLYENQQKNVSALNFDLEDLDFKIQKIEKIGVITASDSMNHLKKELAGYWTNNPEQSLVDTLSFEYVANVLKRSIAHQDTLIKIYTRGFENALKSGDYRFELETEREIDKAFEEKKRLATTLAKIRFIEMDYNEYSKNPEAILSAKYRAVYSRKNPVLSNTKQTFDKIFYTNKEQTKFVREESTSEE